jgi:peroxiredoxin
LEQQITAIEAAGGSAVGIAVTATFSQQQFASDLQLSYPLLSDWNREVSSAWGVAYTEWKGHRGVAKRSVFVIDRDGVVRYRWVTDDALQLPDIEEAVTALLEVATPA